MGSWLIAGKVDGGRMVERTSMDIMKGGRYT